MISEKAVKIHVEFYSFLYRIEVDETSLREFAAKLQGHTEEKTELLLEVDTSLYDERELK